MTFIIIKIILSILGLGLCEYLNKDIIPSKWIERNPLYGGILKYLLDFILFIFKVEIALLIIILIIK